MFAIQYKDFNASHKGKVAFSGVPDHVGIPGNEAADRLARSGTERPIDLAGLSHEHYKRGN